MREKSENPRGKGLGITVFFGLFLVAVFLLFKLTDVARAASNVTLTGSAFSDTDAEDTHQASQWIVRDSGGTVYDSGTDLANLTTITIAGATFTSGTTYYWKVRYQDQHEVWSLYSDENSFVYGGGTVTATPTPSSTPTSTPSYTPTPSATSTVCNYGTFICIGDWCGCMDAPQPRNAIYVP